MVSFMETYYIWVIAGILMILAEFIVPGLIVIFFGTSALITGLVMAWGLPSGNGIPFILFSVLAIVQIAVLRRVFKPWFLGGSVDDDSALEEYIGHEAVVLSGFEDGAVRGQVDFKGTTWTARLENPEAVPAKGERVRITARDGLTLTITSINS